MNETDALQSLSPGGQDVYTLGGRLLSEFGIVPGAPSGSNFPLSGAWDMPSRLGTAYRLWPDSGIEPYVDPDDLLFGGRNLLFTGYIEGPDAASFKENVAALKQFLGGITTPTPLSCYWGEWLVRVEQAVEIEPVDDRFATLKIPFREINPSMGGGLPLGNGGEIDEFNWADFGVVLSACKGRLSLPALNGLKISQDTRDTRFAPGAYAKKELTLTGSILAPDYGDFTRHLASLRVLLSRPGLRKLFDCPLPGSRNLIIRSSGVEEVPKPLYCEPKVLYNLEEGFSPEGYYSLTNTKTGANSYYQQFGGFSDTYDPAAPYADFYTYSFEYRFNVVPQTSWVSDLKARCYVGSPTVRDTQLAFVTLDRAPQVWHTAELNIDLRPYKESVFGAKSCYFGLRFLSTYSTMSNIFTMEIRRVKLEQAYRRTEWTPAVEDAPADVSCLAADGFKITNLQMGTQVSAAFEVKMTVVDEKQPQEI